MFDELGLTVGDYNIDFDLGNAASDIDGHIAKLKRAIAKGAKTGGRIGTIEVMVSPSFFDALAGHAKMREAYIYYQVQTNNSDVVRGDLAKFEPWGVVDTFKHKGVLFYSYDAEFLIDAGDGTYVTEAALGSTAGRDVNTATIANAVGYTVVQGMRGLYKGVFGPANTLSGANAVGSEIMVNQYTDPKDKFHEMELEMSNLYYLTRPQMSYRVFTSS